MAAEEERLDEADRGWYRSPALLGSSVLALTVVVSLFFI
jgi:hypothetical protein